MKKYNGDLGALLEVQCNSIVSSGLEFRDVDTLQKIFGPHPNWMQMSKIRENGSDWPLEPLDEELRCNAANAALAFGNHKGASLQPELLQKLVSKDVRFGYCLPLPLNKTRKIPGLFLPQWTFKNRTPSTNMEESRKIASHTTKVTNGCQGHPSTAA